MCKYIKSYCTLNTLQFVSCTLIKLKNVHSTEETIKISIRKYFQRH